MNDLESRLRSTFQRQVTAAPDLVDFPNTVVRRGQRVRRRRALAGATGLVAVVLGSLVLAQSRPTGHPVGLTPGAETTPTATATSGYADADWLSGLVTAPVVRPYTVAAGTTLYRNRHETGESGFPANTTIHQVTDVAHGRVVTAGPNDNVPQTAYYDESGTQRWVIEKTGFSHAVDPTGTRVALSVNGRREVVDLATGSVSHELSFPKPNDEGSPVAWTSSGVLVSAGDGGSGHADLWQPDAGTNRTVSGPYQGAQDMVGDLVALRVGDGLCIGVSRLTLRGDRFSDCEHGSARFSPSGSLVALWGQGSAAVRSATDGRLYPVALPSAGVLAVGWDGEGVIAVVVARSEVANIATHVVRCATDRSACEDLRSWNGDQTAAVVAGVVGA